MILRSIACLLVALAGATPGSPRAADAACSAAGELCMPGVSGTEQRIAPPRGRIDVVRLRSASDVRNASIRPLAFDEIQLLHQMFGALVVNETVHVDRGYMFSLDRKNSRAENWKLQNAGAARLVTEDGYRPDRAGSRFGATPLYENRGRLDDIWVAPNDAHLLASRVIPARLTDWNSSGELQDLLMRYVETRLETGQRSRYWSHSLPEWHIAWSLALGLLVVALRRMPLRFRSNGL